MNSETERTPADIMLTGTDIDKYQYLAGLPRAAYDRIRDDIANNMGIRVSTLDTEVEKLRRPANKSKALTLSDPEPWPEEVSGAALLASIEEQLNKYVVMSEPARVAVTLWITLTYLVDAVFILPLLLITSPQKRCGKSTLLILLYALCRKPLLASNTSKAAIFRFVETHKPTLLLDEADSWARDDDELRGLINCGHSRSTAKVLRCDGERLEPRLFDTFCPKVLAGIGSLADTIHDRAVMIQMRRRAPNEAVSKLRQDKLDLDYLRAKARSWADQHSNEIKDADPQVPTALHDRAADNWRPLLAIAELAGPLWADRARRAAQVLSQADNDDDDIRTQLLADTRQIFTQRDLEQKDVEKMASADLVQALADLEARPWGDWKHGKPISAVQYARLLKPFGISTFDMREGRRVYKAYRRSAFQESFTRYLQPDVSSATPLQRHDLPHKDGNVPATPSQPVADRTATDSVHVADQNESSHENCSGCSAVAVRDVEIGVLEI
jgi:putative DNA primase/helicase